MIKQIHFISRAGLIFGLLAISFLPSVVFAQTTSDAMDFSKSIFSTLCSSGEPAIIPVLPGLSEKQKQVVAFDFAKNVANRDVNRGAIFRKIQISTADFGGGSGSGKISFYDAKAKTLLVQYAACSPLHVVFVENATAPENRFAPVDTNYEKYSCTKVGIYSFSGFKKNAQGQCERTCPAQEHLVFVDMINGKIRKYRDQRSSAHTVSGCVPCGAGQVQGKDGYTLTNADTNECYNFDDCAEGYEKTKINVAGQLPDAGVEDITRKSTMEHISRGRLSQNDAALLNAQKSTIFPQTICAQKCNFNEARDNNGSCVYSEKQSCKAVLEVLTQLDAWNPSDALKIKNYLDCSSQDLFEMAKQKKEIVTKIMENQKLKCNSHAVDKDELYQALDMVRYFSLDSYIPDKPELNKCLDNANETPTADEDKADVESPILYLRYSL